jgi:hypothetical protein
MSKLKVQMKSKAQMTKSNRKERLLTLSYFDIPLAFACLPCTILGSGPAGRQGFWPASAP